MKAHLLITAGPATERDASQGLCGVLIPSARFAFVWDTAVMGASWRDSLNALNTCKKCLDRADEWAIGEEGYVYAITSEKPSKSGAKVEVLEESA